MPIIELPLQTPDANFLTGTRPIPNSDWGQGDWPDYVQWVPECDMPVTTFPRCLRVEDIDGNPFTEAPKPTCPIPDTPVGIPFWVPAASTCGTDGYLNVAQHEARARRALDAKLPARLAETFWTGQVNGAAQWAVVNGVRQAGVSLAGNAIVLSGGAAPTFTASSVPDGVAAILRAAETCGQPEVTFHMPGWMSPRMTNDGQAARRGNAWYLYNEFPLILGAGYPGTGPTNQIVPVAAPAANQAWIYGTGPVYRAVSSWTHVTGVSPDGQAYGPDDLLSAQQNVIEVRAEKLALAVTDPCCIFAVLVQW